MYKWQTNGIISWQDGDGISSGVDPLLLSDAIADWTDAYTNFSASWSLLGILNALYDAIGAIPTDRFWLEPVFNTSLSEPVAPTLGVRYLVNGTATGGANWLVDGPAGGPIVNCVAECTGVGPSTWKYWGDPAVWGGAQDEDLPNGACVWVTQSDNEWIYNGDGSPAAWIQCGGSTMEKVTRHTTSGTKAIDAVADRGRTFIATAAGTTTYRLPISTYGVTQGLWVRIYKDVAPETGDVDIEVISGELDLIRLVGKDLELHGTAETLMQEYRKIRLKNQGDYVDLLSAYDGWRVVGGQGVIVDESPLDASGTCAALSTSFDEIKLQAGASSNNYEYQGRLIYIKAGTNAGQIRRIISYNGTTKIAQVYPAFTAMCDTDSEYVMVQYDDYYLGFGSIDTVYPNLDRDDYVMDSRDEGLFTGLATFMNYPTLARRSGQNNAEAFGGLLLGYQGSVKNQATFSSVFGANGIARWDSQFVFGGVNQASNKGEQTSRVVLFGTPKAGGTPTEMILGSGYGKNTLDLTDNRLYYVLFSVVARYDDLGVAKYISWSGSVLAVCSAGTASLIAGSKNITETGNSNSPDLELDVAVTSDRLQIMATNNEATDDVLFVGFADIIEVYVPSPV
jgi:hypothetical protein